MFAEIMSKASLDGKDKVEGIRQFLLDRNWSADLMWHREDHVSCKGHRHGHWALTSYGFYQGSDWKWRWYLGYRCTTCATMVQWSQITDADGANPQPVTRTVYVP